MKEHLIKNKVAVIAVIIVLVLVTTYGFIVGGGGHTLKELWLSWTVTENSNPKPNPGSEPTLVAEPEPILEPEQPVTEPEPILEPEQPTTEPEPIQKPTPEPVQEPQPAPQPKPDTKPAIPTIYINQQLKIPVAGKTTTTSVSKVVKEGILSSSSKQIALTFDAGWLYDQTVELLNTLDEYQVKATFFLRGHWVKDHPDLAKEIRTRGHAVENHSLTHSHMKAMSDNQVINEMVESTKIITNTTGYRPYLFRPPFGEYDSRILRILGQQGYPYTIMWTVDSHDWAEELNGVKITEEYLINRVLSNATNKGIVLMHVGGYQTIKALPEIITGLKSEGYKLVKVNDMLPRPITSTSQVIHTVVKGDTLYSISQKYGITVDEIIKANGLE